jgi:murein L,D-transpeptidase YafK
MLYMMLRILPSVIVPLVMAYCIAGIRVNNVSAGQMKTKALPKADQVIVDKSDRTVHLLNDGRTLRVYNIAIGSNTLGHKQRRGDMRTPEGRYILDFRNPQSGFYKSIHISYPNKADIAAAKEKNVDPGGDIYIHGLPASAIEDPWNYETDDWTDGCIAVSNEAIDEIWKMVPNGTPIEIYP